MNTAKALPHSVEKMNSLRQYLKEKGRVMVAFSGGVDSTFLLAVARDVLGQEALAVTGTSPSYPSEDFEEARALAETLGVRHMAVETSELSCESFASNPPDRCYHCKKELYTLLAQIAAREGVPVILDGSNADDTFDFRPGAIAAREVGVESPLKKFGFTKKDIRQLARALGLPNYDKPAQPCLSSRFPYGSRITLDKLKQVYNAERYLKKKGLRVFRVRHHETIARIEISREEQAGFLSSPWLDEMLAFFKELGFTYVTLDLQGFRSGSMNETLTEDEKIGP